MPYTEVVSLCGIFSWACDVEGIKFSLGLSCDEDLRLRAVLLELGTYTALNIIFGLTIALINDHFLAGLHSSVLILIETWCDLSGAAVMADQGWGVMGLGWPSYVRIFSKLLIPVNIFRVLGDSDWLWEFR